MSDVSNDVRELPSGGVVVRPESANTADRPEGAPWIQTATGGRVDLLAPRREQINLRDIAASLARIPRFGGHALGLPPWSVADHSLLVEHLMPANVPAEARLAALLHDADEAYTGDITAPMKLAIRRWLRGIKSAPDPIKAIASGLHAVINEAIGVPAGVAEDWRSQIKHADLLALAAEKAAFMRPEPAPWIDLPDASEVEQLRPLGIEAGEQAYFRRAMGLVMERHGLAGAADAGWSWGLSRAERQARGDDGAGERARHADA